MESKLLRRRRTQLLVSVNPLMNGTGEIPSFSNATSGMQSHNFGWRSSVTSTNLTASPISSLASPAVSTPEKQYFGEDGSTPTVPLLMSNYTIHENLTENNESPWPPSPLVSPSPAPQPNQLFGSSNIPAIPTGSSPFTPTFPSPFNSAVRPVDAGNQNGSTPTTGGVAPTESAPTFLFPPPPSFLPAANPASQNEFVPTIGGVTPPGTSPFSPTFQFPSPSSLRPAQNEVDVPSFLLRPSAAPQPPATSSLTSPPPFFDPSSHDTHLSLASIASIVVLELTCLLVCLCCCFRYLCTLSDTDPFGKRGAYRRIAEDDSDAFNAGFDENDDIYFDDSETDADAIELNELDNGDIALEEVNG